MRRAPLLLLAALAGCSGEIDPPGDAAGDGRAGDLARGDGSLADLSPRDGAAPDLAADPCLSGAPCPMGQRCVPMGGSRTCVDPCAGVTCTAPATCFVYDVNGVPLQMDAYGPVGVCLDPCANVSCAMNQTCVPSAHGVPLGACVDRCDCRNCGNCDANGTFVGMQAFCGNPNGMPATMACTVPCGGGQGCIPWDASGGICWPLEGCFSM